MKTIAQILDEDTQSHAERFQKMADAHAKLMNHHDKLAVNHVKAGAMCFMKTSTPSLKRFT